MGCGGEAPPQPQQQQHIPSWEEFRAQVYQEPETGIFIVDGDEPIQNEALLRAFYDEVSARQAAAAAHEGLGESQQPLTVINFPSYVGMRNYWSVPDALNLTYCIDSVSFGGNYTNVVNAMHTAAANWKATGASVNFVHVSSLDSNCTSSTTSVVFNVRLVSGQPYLARSFFPGDSRPNREVLVDSTSFGYIAPWTLAGILRHELGHTLGFRHEHIRVPQTGNCLEDDPYWRALTDYDSASVMHYPQCGGTNTGDLNLTSLDVQGVKSLYHAILKPNQGLSAGQSLSSNDGRFSLAMQTDGNLVLYWNGHGALWSTNTWNSQGKLAWMQDDGNFVLYTTTTPTYGYSLWSTDTYGPPGAYLALQNDGNLVVYDADGVTALWNSGTWGH